jgi:hypothetical protein
MRREHRTHNEGQARRRIAPDSMLRRHPLALLAGLVPAVVAAVAVAAGGSPKPPTPSITARPADPTNQTSAQFHYSAPTPGASFECQLDSGAFASCPAAGKSYAGPLAQGKHTFKVRIVSGGKTGSDAAYSWTVDTTPPSVALAFPVNGSALSSAAWGHGCPGRAGICGSASDQNDIDAVSVSIRQGSGKWWGGSAFDRTSETFQPASVTSGRGRTAWSYPMALPADGTYTVHVRALDEAGNTTAEGSQAAASFTIDTLAPPAPTISSGPDTQTVQKSATFAFGDSEPGVTFLCSRDRARAKACKSPIVYPSNGRGEHTFVVQAKDGAGNVSGTTTYKWSVVKKLEESGKPFSVAGSATGPLAPGFSSPLALTVTNPNNVAITVTDLKVSVATASSKAGCEGPANLALTQSNISAANPLVVPANGHASVPSGAVSAASVLMKDLSTNQDACKNASFTFNYSGSAHS